MVKVVRPTDDWLEQKKPQTWPTSIQALAFSNVNCWEESLRKVCLSQHISILDRMFQVLYAFKYNFVV